MTSDEHYFPSISKVSIQIYFPPEVKDAALYSEQGIFSFEGGRGEWTFDPASIMKSDQDDACEKLTLRGSVKATT